MQSRKGRIIKYVLLAVLILTIGLLLVFALLKPYDGEFKAHLSFELVRSETMMIIVAIAGLLIVFVIAMVISMARSFRSMAKKEEIVAEEIIHDRDDEIPAAEKTVIVEVEDEGGMGMGGGPGLMMPSDIPTRVEIVEEDEETERAPRFCMLNEIDKTMSGARGTKRPESKISLEELCVRFRNYAAGKMGLYYSMDDIRRFVASLAVTHIVIMQGMSGTGKTSLAYAFGEFLGNPAVIVPIQPMWKERTDMIGYYNEFTKRFNETVLLRKMYEAGYNREMYITVLDEMNIARVEYYFAEFLSLLEIPDKNKRYLDVVSDHWDNDPKNLRDGQIRLPDNMWFIGTANNDDSTFAISDKVYDRAMVLNLDQKAEPFEVEAEDAYRVRITTEHWQSLVEDALHRYELTERNARRLAKLDEYLVEKFHVSFGNRIMKQIHQYIPVCVACGGDELDALDDILARKVLRKLEAQNPVYVRSAAGSLINYMEELFGADKMKLCRRYLRQLERSA